MPSLRPLSRLSASRVTAGTAGFVKTGLPSAASVGASSAASNAISKISSQGNTIAANAVYAPGRITSHRLQGAAVVYLNLATIFGVVFSLIWDLNPSAFANVPAPIGGPGELAAMLYFSLTTLATTGYGDIVPVDPLAHSMANLASIIGQFYLAITVARLVTLELEHRRRG
jgi:hypothetical protein